MRMYFRTDYYSYVATIDTFVQLKKGNAYEVFADLDEYYIIMMDGMPFEKELGIVVVIPKEDLEDDVYVVTGKSEKLEEGGGAIRLVLTIVNRDVRNEPLQNITEHWLDIRLSVESRLHISCQKSSLNRFSVERLLLMS